MDAFYASVEQRDNPALRGKPIAVGGGGNRGVTTTASYEARKYGVRSAMPGYQAKRLCPDLIFVKPRFSVYSEVSKKIREIFKQYTDIIEPLSLDEAFLDVSSNKHDIESATMLAKKIIEQIRNEQDLTCSAGVSYCKFLAKVVSGLHKPNAISVIKPEHAQSFLSKLEVEKFFGVGAVTARKMKQMGIHTGEDLLQWSKLELAKAFGKSGRFYYDIVRGIDNRPVITDQVRKSLAVERTLEYNLKDKNQIRAQLDKVLEEFYMRLERSNNYGRTITLKIKTGDFRVITRSRSNDHFITEKETIVKIAHALLDENFDAFEEIRLIGLNASNLQSEWFANHSNQLRLKL